MEYLLTVIGCRTVCLEIRVVRCVESRQGVPANQKITRPQAEVPTASVDQSESAASASESTESTVSSKPLLRRYDDGSDGKCARCWQISNEIRKLDFSFLGSKDLVTDLDQYIASRQRKIDEAELCSTQQTFNSGEDVSVDTLTNLEVKEDTQMEDYLIETSEECEVFQIEPEIVIALNEGEDEMKIDVNLDKPEKPQIESEEDQLLVLIFYTTDTFVLDEPDTIDSFMLEVPDELLNLKEGVHASLPNYVDAPFVVDISKGEGIT
ncbi:hypothetical protein Syun_004133 [Stephania yunnanensis]|uniref:Uncharacterized protein n=1 Tax=Stephania yunnanensis TaxID=152371 RepID=A0AAP0L2R1_9MAGN